MSTVVITVVDEQIHLSQKLLAAMAKFGIEPKLTSPEVLTGVFLALIFNKMKRENLLVLSGENREHEDPYRWAYLLSEGKVHMHQMVQLFLTLSGVDLHLTSSKVLTRFFLLACLHEINVDEHYSIHTVRQLTVLLQNAQTHCSTKTLQYRRELNMAE
ncbi:hypothetical protein XENOCAPTIV_020648, partial [Xenoophorus captivus]